MSETEILDYFDAINYFDRNYEKGKGDADQVIKQMYKHWPNTTMRLLMQGFFVSVLMHN